MAKSIESDPIDFTEFDLIGRYFSRLGPRRGDVLLGIGDDCALLRPPRDMDLATSMDTLLAGHHFFPDVDPESLGYKCLAVNLSDLAAMGASPAWATLALSLPEVDESWLEGFAKGFSALAEQSGIALVGGDTTRGPLSITVQVQGFVPAGRALRRAAARPGDLIHVSGTLGDAALALRQIQRGQEPEPSLRRRLERPWPRLELGERARDIAHACIDISDGLAADLGHICRASGVGAIVETDRLPLSGTVAAYLAQDDDWPLVLAGGDDYELCLTVDPARSAELEATAGEVDVPLTCIGRMERDGGVRCRQPGGDYLILDHTGFEHFND